MYSSLWLLIMGFIVSFGTLLGIGANDVANSFATSVGAKVLTMRTALIVAGIFEFSGSFAGSRVSDTVRKKIIDQTAFDDYPFVFMFGMLTSMMAAGTWLGIATWLRMPVSTTHSIIGAIIGFALAFSFNDGSTGSAIDWVKVGWISFSWVAAPFCSGLLTTGIYDVIKYFALRSAKPVHRSLIIFPPMLGVTISIIAFFLIYKGLPQLDLDERYTIPEAIGISIGCGVVFMGISIFVVHRWLYDKIMNATPSPDETLPEEQGEQAQQAQQAQQEEQEQSHVEHLALQVMDAQSMTDAELPETHHHFNHRFANMPLYDVKAEKLFSYLQIVTASMSSFAHGANDVANGIAPLAAMLSIYQDSTVEQKSDIPWWILLMGGAGIVIGLFMWGERIIIQAGSRITGITPSRGFSIELGAVLAVLISTMFELPVSTTHCQIGSIIASGMCDGGYKSVDWKICRKIFYSWFITLPFTAAMSGLLFSFAFYSPPH